MLLGIAMATSTRISWWSIQGYPRTIISKQGTTYIAKASVDASGVRVSIRRLHRTCKSTGTRKGGGTSDFRRYSKTPLCRKKCILPTCDSALGRHERALDNRVDGVRRQTKSTSYPSPTTIPLLLPDGRRGVETSCWRTGFERSGSPSSAFGSRTTTKSSQHDDIVWWIGWWRCGARCLRRI